MPASKPPPAPWARIHVLSGADPQRIVFEASRPVALTIGSSPHARLCLVAPCVAPEQLEVFWDGAALWLQDRLRLGSTLVNGRPLNEWALIRGQVLVVIGSVRIWMAAGSPHPTPALPDFALLSGLEGEDRAARERRRTPTVRLLLTPELEAKLNEVAES